MIPALRTTGAALLVAVFLVLPLLPAAQAQLPTFYEVGPMSAQNMDYDRVNKTFPAHAGWLDDRLIHYYKFRMYTPDTYPTKVKPGSAPEIPVVPVYLPTRNGTLAGSVGQAPVFRYHTVDGENYSDFVEIHLVNFSGSAPRSWPAVQALRDDPVPTGIIVNMPMVPLGSRLEDPKGGLAPIKPLTGWYKEEEVQAFVFETSSQALADLWNPLSREGNASLAGSGYEMTVARLNTSAGVPFIPIWHVNQYFEGVTPGVNSGGPSDRGMRNVIDLDRNDPGYSPLWQVHWVTQLPPDYAADQASDAEQFTPENGFRIMPTPMYVNCPNIGPHGGSTNNTAKKATFEPLVVLNGTAPVKLHGSLVMMGGKNVTAKLDGIEIANTTTNMMGGFVFNVDPAIMTTPTGVLTVEDDTGAVVASWNATGPVPPSPTPVATPTPSPTPDASPTPPPTPSPAPVVTPTPTPLPTPSPAEEPRDTPLAALPALGALLVAALAGRRRRA